MAKHLDTGKWGERHAARALKRAGYRILGQRVRVGDRDELDIVARDGAAVVFVEVKTRASEGFGRPADAVNRSKRRVLSRAAVRYLKRLKRPPDCFRFDVVEVVGRMEDGLPKIRHIEDAFSLDSRYVVPD